MILRELFIFILVLAGFASAVAAYLLAFHGASSVKEVLSTAFAGTLGVYVGRYIERRLARG
ncbi:hypothetical protein [Caenibius tardaugens]|uniref:hypothetical protein n=1 Tax=Caenibius tardaugens TaxID=169176 RepID=UPI00041107CA|nr:hypothetical protein [Caenibius tardaugens]AZI37987.1 hypothetical protein EGO55_20125 [Caenibius tardaugens NBRC 16725]